jgi:hypothetical protein
MHQPDDGDFIVLCLKRKNRKHNKKKKMSHEVSSSIQSVQRCEMRPGLSVELFVSSGPL